jgi:hypothetical protein
MEKLSIDTDVVKLSTAKTAKTTSRQSSDAFRGMMQNISENQNSGSRQTKRFPTAGRRKQNCRSQPDQKELMKLTG